MVMQRFHKTECEKRGYDIGDRFRVIKENHDFGVGSVLELHYDYESACSALFKFVSGRCSPEIYRNDGSYYVNFKNIEKIEDGKMDIKIPCPEGYEFNGIRILNPGENFLSEIDYKGVATWDDNCPSEDVYIALKKKQPYTLKFEFERVDGLTIERGMYWTDDNNKIPVWWDLDTYTIKNNKNNTVIWRLKDSES